MNTITPVRLVAHGPAHFQVHGRLCLPSSGQTRTVQLLVPGGAYDHSYWDFPYRPERYSYVRAMAESGKATFTIDPIGSGRSSLPLGASVTLSAVARTVHQLIRDLRGGAIGDRSFRKVVLEGHSVGSAVAWVEAATYRDIDGLIVTGMMHPNPLLPITLRAIVGLGTSVQPAMLDPKFRYVLDPTYITTRPGTRAGLFYNPADTDPEVPVVDEQTKATLPLPEMAFPVHQLDGLTRHINVPTLVVEGGKDKFFCAGLGGRDCSSGQAIRRHEAPYYGPGAQLQGYVLPNAGHCINLERNAQEWYRAASRWIDTAVH